MADGGCRMSDVGCLMSDVRWDWIIVDRVLLIKSKICDLTSDIKQSNPISDIRHQTSEIKFYVEQTHNTELCDY
jgi:hypothetical protein